MAWMALFKYFQLKTTHKHPLPDPNGELSSKISSSGISSANACIGKLLISTSWSGDTHSRGPRMQFYHQLRGLKLAAEIGTTAEMRSFAILFIMATAHEYYPPLFCSLNFHQ